MLGALVASLAVGGDRDRQCLDSGGVKALARDLGQPEVRPKHRVLGVDIGGDRRSRSAEVARTVCVRRPRRAPHPRACRPFCTHRLVAHSWQGLAESADPERRHGLRQR